MKRLRTLLYLLPVLMLLPSNAAALELPPFEQFKGPGGLNVVVVHDDSLPYLKVHFAVPVGSLQDPKTKEGVSTFAAQLLSYGTSSLDQGQVAEKLDGLGATFQAWSDQETFAATGDVATLEPEVRDAFLNLFLDLSTAPSFSSESLEKYRKMHLGRLQNLLDDNAGLASRAIHQWALANHPYGRTISGTIESVARIKTDDLHEFHRRYVIPSHAWLFVAGDVDRDYVEQLLNQHEPVQAWAKDSAGVCVAAEKIPGWCASFCGANTPKDCVDNQRISIPAAPQGTGPQLLLVDKNDPELTQVQFRVAFPLKEPLGSDPWYAYRLGATILGGDYTARLNRVLRIEQGLTYGARISGSYSTPFPGTATLQTYTKPSDVTRAIDLALEQMSAFAEHGPTPQEIASFKDKIVNKRAFLFEKIDGLIDQLFVVRMYQLGLDFIRKYEEKIVKVEAKQAQDAVAQVFRLNQARIVVIGNASDRATYEPWIKKKGGTIRVIPAERVLHERW